MTSNEDRAFIRGIDDLENPRSRLPEGERVDLLSIWVAECYAPSQTDDLVAGFGELSWEGSDKSRSPSAWIEQWRWSPGGSGYFPLNNIRRPGDRGFLGDRLVADLPEIVESANGIICRLFPGLFVVVLQFYLDTTVSERPARPSPHRRPQAPSLPRPRSSN